VIYFLAGTLCNNAEGIKRQNAAYFKCEKQTMFPNEVRGVGEVWYSENDNREAEGNGTTMSGGTDE